MSNSEKKVVAICRVDRSGWYSVQRVVEVDGATWSVYWAETSTFKRQRDARHLARRHGHVLPGLYEQAGMRQPANLLVPVGVAA